MTGPCSHKGCPKEGLFPAPQSPQHPHPYHYFCLEHIRVYNAKWNCFLGLNEEGIEKRIREATVWERPTWPFGKGPVSFKNPTKRSSPKASGRIPPQIIQCLATLGLSAPCSLMAVKKKYRELAKQFHPDTNHGQQTEIAQFYAIQEAFGTLQTYYAKPHHTNSTQE